MEVRKWLEEYRTVGLLALYESDGQIFAEWVNFQQHSRRFHRSPEPPWSTHEHSTRCGKTGRAIAHTWGTSRALPSSTSFPSFPSAHGEVGREVARESDTAPEKPPEKGADRADLKAAQVECQRELEEAARATGMSRDVLLARHSRTPGGQVITNISGCSSVPWLNTATSKLRGARLLAIGDAASRGAPSSGRRPTAAETTLAAVRSLPDPEDS